MARLSGNSVEVKVWDSMLEGKRFRCFFKVGRNTIKLYGEYISVDEVTKAAKQFGANDEQLKNIGQQLSECGGANV